MQPAYNNSRIDKKCLKLNPKINLARFTKTKIHTVQQSSNSDSKG